jgi:hypothetical protein
LLRYRQGFFFLKEYSLLDIFVKKKVEDKFFWTVGIKNPVLNPRLLISMSGLQSTNLTDTITVPEKYEEYLCYRYGDWRTPVKEYDFKKDDKAIVNKIRRYKMRAIIIAAGKGTRLYPLTKNTPKSLIEVGNGITMLESQLHSLKENGIKDITIIVGYKAEQIEAKIKKYANDFNINTVYNPFYETSNNLISVWMARHFMQGGFHYHKRR